MGCRFLLVAFLISSSGVVEGLPGQKKARAIGGRVTDAGKPVAGARILLRWRVHPELPSLVGYTLGDNGLAEREFESGEKGRFRIRPPGAGPFLIVAKKDGKSSTQVFPVLPGDYHELSLEPDHFMGGVVLGRDGKPVAGAVVRLVPTDGLQRIRLGLYRQPERRPTARTDAEGRFRLHFEHGYLRDPRWNVLMGLQAEHEGVMSPTLSHQRPTNGSKNVTLQIGGKGSYGVTVVDQSTSKPIAGVRVLDPLAPARKVVTDEKGFCRAPPPRGSTVMLIAAGFQTTVVSVGSGGKASFRWSMRPGLTLRTRLSGPNGPLTGARILLGSPLGNAYPMEWHHVVGKDGKVEIRSLPAGRTVMAFVEIDGRFVQFFEDTMTRDTTLPPLRLRPGNHVRGRVLTADKLPVAGARVALQSFAANPGNPRRVTYTDRAGRFRFDSVFRAKHQVIAAKGEHGQTAVTIGIAKLEDPLTITLQSASTIEGRVLRPDGTPAAGAWVSIYRTASGGVIRGPRISSTCLGTMADAEGRFRFGVRPRTSWSIVAAILHQGTHYNYSTSTTAGAKNLTLKVAVASR